MTPKQAAFRSGTLPRLPFYQDLTEEDKRDIKATWKTVEELQSGEQYTNEFDQSQSRPKTNDSTRMQTDNLKIALLSNEVKINSLTSLYIRRALKKKHSVSFSSTVDYVSETQSGCCYLKDDSHTNSSLFGNRETAVFMTLYDDIYQRCSSGTQATALINKSFQVDCTKYIVSNNFAVNSIDSYYNNWSTTTTSTLPNRESKIKMTNSNRNQEVYFFGKKRSQSGMGNKNNKLKTNTSSTQSQPKSSTSAAQTSRKEKGGSKSVSIKETKPCPAPMETGGDLVATVSHIKIAPREGCPVHGKEPCQGSNCILAASREKESPSVKVTTANNPRRGVFELVIRRMTGAPLARNELMLEWTPPPCRPSTCGGGPCPVPCTPLSKCKMIVCRPTPCKPKCCRTSCKRPCNPRPCGPIPCCARPCGQPCRPVPCRKCCKPCAKPCRRPCSPAPRCRPCPPPRCQPCPPPSCLPCPPLLPCSIPCCNRSCSIPCKSTPCLRPCPIGRGRRARKARSSPKIRSHRKKISPCLNRTSRCTMSRCNSLPGPCLGCLPCPPRKCCSIGPCRPSKYFKNVCSTCC